LYITFDGIYLCLKLTVPTLCNILILSTQAYVTLDLLAILFMSFSLLTPRDLYNMAFLSFDYESTWSRLFQKLIQYGFPVFWLWEYLIKVIPETYTIWLSYLLAMRVLDQGYSRDLYNMALLSFDYESTWSRLFQRLIQYGYPIFWLWEYLIKVIPETYTIWLSYLLAMRVLDQSYSRDLYNMAILSFDYEGTWSRLFQKLIQYGSPNFWLWEYLIKVIPETYTIGFSYLLTMRVLDQGYSRDLYNMALLTFDYESTWSRLFQRLIQ
jgi:hypothetical protein